MIDTRCMSQRTINKRNPKMENPCKARSSRAMAVLCPGALTPQCSALMLKARLTHTLTHIQMTGVEWAGLQGIGA